MTQDISKMAETLYPVQMALKETYPPDGIDYNLNKRSIWIEGYTAALTSPASGKNITMKVDFQGPCIIDEKTPNGYIAVIEELHVVDTGKTKLESFKEVMKSVEVLFAYRSGITAEELKSLSETPLTYSRRVYGVCREGV